jgi:hypothetical protein
MMQYKQQSVSDDRHKEHHGTTDRHSVNSLIRVLFYPNCIVRKEEGRKSCRSHLVLLLLPAYSNNFRFRLLTHSSQHKIAFHKTIESSPIMLFFVAIIALLLAANPSSSIEMTFKQGNSIVSYVFK